MPCRRQSVDEKTSAGDNVPALVCPKGRRIRLCARVAGYPTARA
ncbi:MAG: hypothetical protein AVDCRST_MAG88-2838 [uncultured Thermomicrobiales bacterium]|uniref:Uncharacterized protein n=1 Tax=uncultured Thermomicrobiales bacterium TaxID=1645740 RepID=A0A6J4VKG5_9BACT|nr:MAG: hypothetical protein AVDCRST_MAG88-2838 [uncultured Thermomicrobiales bacterium]